MKKYTAILALWLRFMLVLLLGPVSMHPVVLAADLQELGVGARAPGMANAFVGIADDANAVIYNPAGLTQLREAEVSVEYSNYANGLTDGSSFNTSYIGYAQPLMDDRGTLAVALHNFDQANLIKDRTLLVGYGRKLKLNHTNIPGQWSIGANLKQIHRQYNSNPYTQIALNNSGTADSADPLFAGNGYSADAFAADIGIFAQFKSQLNPSLGLSLTNLNNPSLALADKGDTLPKFLKIGWAARPQWGIVSLELRRGKRLASQTDTDVAIGGERMFKVIQVGSLALRGGYAQGSREYQELTLGASFEFQQARLDYAFNIPMGANSEFGSDQRIGFGFKFSGLKLNKPGKNIPKTKSEPHVAVSSSVTTAPEAPPALVAPSMLTSSNTVSRDHTTLEKTARTFTNDLGFYFALKAQETPIQERLDFLMHMKETYQSSGVDISIIEKELHQIQMEKLGSPIIPQTSPQPTPNPTPIHLILPAEKASPRTTPTPVTPIKKGLTKSPVTPVKKAPPLTIKTRIASSRDMDQALNFYRLAVQRGLSDRERIEILEALLKRYGEKAAAHIKPELEKLRKRLK